METITFCSFCISSRGWLMDAKIAYPMHKVKKLCGNKTGIIGSDTVHDKINKMANAWCYTP